MGTDHKFESDSEDRPTASTIRVNDPINKMYGGFSSGSSSDEEGEEPESLTTTDRQENYSVLLNEETDKSNADSNRVH